MKNILGIDIGGTNIRAGVVSESGKIVERKKIPSGAKQGINKVLENVAKLLASFSNYDLDGAGIGIPGIIDKEAGVITQAPNIKNAKNYPIKQILSKNLNIPIQIENDSNCAALGEFWLGAGKNTKSMVMITLGTGLGGGIILNNSLWSGANGMGAEIGHITINTTGPKCNCENYGCLESYVSGEAIRRMVSENKTVQDKLQGVKKEDIPKALMGLATEGNQEALNIWQDFGKHLGVGIANVVNILNPELVVVGGGLSNAWELFIKDTEQEVRKRGLIAPVSNLKIKKAELGDDAGIIGAAFLLINR